MDGQVRLAYMGSFLSADEADIYREEFFSFFGKDIDEGLLVLVEDRVVELNNKFVVRIMAENSQMELEIDDNT